MKLFTYSIGHRLAIGFGIVVFGLLLIVALNLLSFHTILNLSIDIERLTARDKLVIEWLGNVEKFDILSQEELPRKNKPIHGDSKFSPLFFEQKTTEVVGAIDKIQSMLESSNNSSVKEAELLSKIRQQRTEYKSLISFCNKDSKCLPSTDQGHKLKIAIENYVSDLRLLHKYYESKLSASLLELSSTIHNIRWKTVAVSFITVIITIVTSWCISRTITVPIKKVLRVAENIADGNLNISFDASTTRKDQLGELMSTLSNMTDTLRNIINRIYDSVKSMNDIVQIMNLENSELGARTENQAASIEETAATLEQLTSTIKNTADNTIEASSFVSDTTELVNQSTKLMESVSQRMQDIYNHSFKMSEILQTIDGIAFQTNILALNAAVEAARAGEAGRGFAVVASEVRSLAQRCKSAAHDVKNLIDESVSHITDGKELVEEANIKAMDVNKNFLHLNTLISEVAQASEEQSNGISQINIAVNSIDKTTQENATLVEKSSNAVAQLEKELCNLHESMSIFDIDSKSVELTVGSALTLSQVNSHNKDEAQTKNAHADILNNWENF